jgi:hypothetical protein
VHGITSLRISMPEFPWPSIDDQLNLITLPWREVLCPTAGAKPKSGSRR